MDPSRRSEHLISEILERLRELSYEVQRQDTTIADLQSQLAALEEKGPEDGPSGPEQGTVDNR